MFFSNGGFEIWFKGVLERGVGEGLGRGSGGLGRRLGRRLGEGI